MSPWIRPLLALSAGGLVAAGVTVWRRQHKANNSDRWAVVTVLRPQDEIEGAAAYGSLTELRPDVELSLREAPGGRGTEVGARWRSGTRRSRDLLRTRLRELKQALEPGEVLHATPRPEGIRPPTPGGLVIDLVDRRASGKGTL